MAKGMDGDGFKHSKEGIRIFIRESLRFFEGAGFQHDEASTVVCQGASQDHLPLLILFSQSLEMGLSMEKSFSLAFRPILANDHKLHTCMDLLSLSVEGKVPLGHRRAEKWPPQTVGVRNESGGTPGETRPILGIVDGLPVCVAAFNIMPPAYAVLTGFPT